MTEGNVMLERAINYAKENVTLIGGDYLAVGEMLCEFAEQELQDLKDRHAEEVELHLHAEDYIKSLEQQIEKMKCCGNCKYGYCGGSSISIDTDGNRTFHNWNEEKEDYCDVGKNGKYQCWELAE